MKEYIKSLFSSVSDKILRVRMNMTIRSINRIIVKRIKFMMSLVNDCFDIMINGNPNLKGDREIMIETLKTYDETIANLNAEMERYRRHIKSFDKGEMTSLGEILHDL